MTTAQRLARLLLRSADAAQPSPAVLPPRREAATVTTPRQALTLDSVYRCVSVIQTAAKQLSLDVWRRDAGGRSIRLDDAPPVIARPDADTSTTDLIAETVASLALRGNAYWLIAHERDGRPSGVRVLDPMACTPVLELRTGARTVQWDGRTWAPEDLRHLRLVRVPGAAEGLGPIQACARALTGAADMSTYAADYLQASGVPTGLLTSDQDINAAQAEEAKRRWMTSNGPDQGIAVLGKGLTFHALSLKPSEVQFLESRAFDVLAVGRMFGVPAHMLLASVNGSSMTYQNVTDASLDFVRWTVMGYLREIEEALTAVLPRGTTARFNLDALLRADAATRMTTHEVAIRAGVYDSAEARRIEGLNPTTASQEPTND
ncbi:MAG: phage portal protein [Actinomyces urogenitalis]|uniref:phage portal protein n=1 Tax=Actinomyces urogenitalis TaxID=103621 RepID=UPI00242C2C13|nr:phage portal protein [Actinomyces urogenitalis]MBS5978049.1 phage portal protein [Actinomyces urogenitalis]